MSHGFEDLRVLIVDDSRSMRRIIRKYFENSGVSRIAEAENGRAALDLLRFQDLDLIVSDLNMPVMTGLELLKELKQDSELHGICFVILTVEANQRTMNRALALGADAYIIKPVTEDLFIQEIRQYLSSEGRM